MGHLGKRNRPSRVLSRLHRADRREGDQQRLQKRLLIPEVAPKPVSSSSFLKGNHPIAVPLGGSGAARPSQ